jgi:hypothetical protein
MKYEKKLYLTKSKFGVSGLSKEDRKLIDEGVILLFENGPCGGTWGTTWRYVKKTEKGYYNAFVVTSEMIEEAELCGDKRIL